MANFLFVLSQDGMVLDGGPHLIDLAAEAKVFNF